MNDENYVNLDKLLIVATDIDRKKDEILTLYDMKIKTILDYSCDCITQNGDSFDEFNSEFAKLFKELDKRLTELTSTLTNIVVPNYQDFSTDIKELFNNQFALELEKLLDMKDK